VTQADTGLRRLALAQIDPNPRQARKRFAGIEALAESMKRHGQLEPVVVRPLGRRWELIAGERRWRAAKLAGLDSLEAVVREATDRQAYEWGLVENVQRDNLSPVEEAEAFRELQAGGLTQRKIAALVGKTQGYVSGKLRLLKLLSLTRLHLDTGFLTEAHAQQLLRLPAILRHAKTPGPYPNITDFPHLASVTWPQHWENLLVMWMEDADFDVSVSELTDKVDTLRYMVCRICFLAMLLSPDEEEMRRAMGIDYSYRNYPPDLTKEEHLWPIRYAAAHGLLPRD
jgi:ParB/RepB/Spo0J family partition protein